MAYKQQHQYTYRDSLAKGDAEKVIKGEYFDDEFSAIEAGFEAILGDDSVIDPSDPAFGDVVFQNRTTDQQVISKFTFQGEKPTENGSGNRFVVDPTLRTARFYSGQDAIGTDGSNPWDVQIDGSLVAYANVFPPSSMAYTPSGMSGATEVYITYRNADDPDNPINPDPQPAKWLVKPNLDVDGNIDATGNISMDGNLAIGGVIDGDLTVNGNINIDGGGSIIAPGGDGHIEDGTQENQIAHWHSGSDKWIGVANVTVSDSGQMAIGAALARSILHIKAGSPSITFENANGDIAQLGIDSIDTTIRAYSDFTSSGDISAAGTATAGSLVKSGGTSDQLLCADGSVVDKDTVGGDTDLSDYYTKTESDGRYEPKIATKNTAFNKNFGTTSGTVSQGNHTHSDAVKTSGNQTIGGAKTFSSNVTAPDFVATSDIAMKMNVQTAPVGLIDQIRGVEFDWRNSGNAASGVIANEIEKVLPHLVQEHQGVKHVSYMGLIAYLIEEIKALKNGD